MKVYILSGKYIVCLKQRFELLLEKMRLLWIKFKGKSMPCWLEYDGLKCSPLDMSHIYRRKRFHKNREGFRHSRINNKLHNPRPKYIVVFRRILPEWICSKGKFKSHALLSSSNERLRDGDYLCDYQPKIESFHFLEPKHICISLHETKPIQRNRGIEWHLL